MIVGTIQYLYIGIQCFFLILADNAIAVKIMILRIGSDPVIISFPYQIIIFMIHGNLCGDLLPVALRDFRYIQLIAKGSCQCHIPSCFKRSHSAYCMVRAVRNMCSHCGQWIDQCRTFLDLQSFNRIGIIRTPDLRAVIQHTRIKSCTAAGAVLQKKVWELCHHSLLHFINSQYITVIQLTHLICWKLKGTDV